MGSRKELVISSGFPTLSWAQRRPRISNPYMFIHTETAMGVDQVNYNRVNARLGHRAQKLREDRILDETIASRGGLRRLCDMFGLTVGAAKRYVHKSEQPIDLHPDVRAPRR